MTRSRLLSIAFAGGISLSLLAGYPMLADAQDNQQYFKHDTSTDRYSEETVDIDVIQAQHSKTTSAKLRELATLSMQYKKIYDADPATVSSTSGVVDWLSSLFQGNVPDTARFDDNYIDAIIGAQKKAASDKLKKQLSSTKTKLEEKLNTASENNKKRIQQLIDNLNVLATGGDIDPADPNVAANIAAAKTLIENPNATPEVPGFKAGPSEDEVFKTTYHDTIEKDPSSVTTNDEEKVKQALDAFKELQPASREKLTTEKGKLDALQQQINKLKEIDKEVKDFKSAYDTTANTPLESVTPDNEAKITEALNKLDTLKPESKKQLETEKDKLEALKKKVEELKAINTEVAEFKKNYDATADIDPESVTPANEAKVEEALKKLTTLKPQSQDKLAAEKKKLEALKQKIAEKKASDTEVSDFRRDHGPTAAISPDKVTTADEGKITAALDKLKTLKPESIAQLNDEKTKLEALKQKVNELKEIDKEVAEFKHEHGTTVDISPDNVRSEDEGKIDAALQKLGTLKQGSQDKLASDKQKLEALKQKIADKNAVDKEVSEFRRDHGPTAAIPVENVQISDEEKIKAALDKLETLRSESKTQLESEKTQLEALKQKVKELKAIDKEVSDFRRDHGDTAAIAPENVTPEDEAKVDAALDKLKTLKPESIAQLNDEKTKLEALKQKITDNKAAQEFTTTHADILSKTEDSLALTDEAALNAALEAYGQLPQGAQEKLSAEKALLDRLATKLAAMKALDAEIKEFKEKHKAALDREKPLGPLTGYDAVRAALADYEHLSAAAKEALAEDKKYLDSLLKSMESDRAEIAAEDTFRKDHEEIINKPLASVGPEDKALIDAALNSYAMLSPEVQRSLKAVYRDLQEKQKKLEAANAQEAAQTKKARQLPKTADSSAPLAPVATTGLSLISIAAALLHRKKRKNS